MSASREKKIRQELAAQGVPDIKEIRAAEERKQQRRSNILYGCIAGAFVLVAAALLVWNSNIIQRSSTAISVDGVKYSTAEVDYYYNSAYNNLAGGEYASYLSLNTSTPLSQQVMTDMDLMFTGAVLPEGKEEMTWHEYLVENTKQQLIAQTNLLKAADAEGFTFTDEMQAEIDSAMEDIATYAKTSGVSTGAYLKTMFGASMTEKTFTKLLKDTVLVSYFQQSHWDALTYTDADLTAYYEKNPNQFDEANYEYVYFRGTAPSTTDADGKTVAATDEENAAAKAKAEAAANDVFKRFQAGEDLEKLAEEYKDIASYFHQESASYSGGAVQDWVFDASRKAGDAELVNSGSAYYVVLYHSRARSEYNPVNVRHILCKIDDSKLNSEDAGYADARQALIDMAKVEAEGLLSTFKAGEATPEAFADLASKNSDDSGSVGNGGLYTNVAKGSMVEPFDQWIYDESRKAGDTGLVFVDQPGYYTGYHVMYFEGVADAPYWMLQAESAARTADFNEWLASIDEELTAEEHSGMKYVGA